MKIHFLQTAEVTYRPLLEATSRTVVEYCSRHQCSYESYFGIIRGYHPWHAAFNRIALLKRLVDTGFSGWVCYLDADAYVVDLDFDLKTYLRDKDNVALVIAPGGPTGHWWDVNSGVFLINLAHPVGQAIVCEWSRLFDEIADEQLRAAADWVTDDQTFLHQLLQNIPDAEQFTLVDAEHPRLLNYGDGTFVRQVLRVEGSPEKRADYLRIETDKLLGFTQGSVSELENFSAALDEFIRSVTAFGEHASEADHTIVATSLNEILARYLARSNARRAFSFDFADLITDLRLNHAELCLITIADGGVRISLHKDWRGLYSFDGTVRRCAGVVFLLDRVLRRNPMIRGTFLCELGDRGNFPSVNFSNNTPGGCLIPDPEFFESRGYEATRQQFREDFIPWEQRLAQVFWRGSSTGHRLFDPPGEDAADDFAWLQRLALCARARSAARPDMFDVGLTRIVQIEEPHLVARIERAGFLRPYVPRVEFMRHKGVIVANGNCNAWDAAFCGLLTGSCVLLIGSPLRYRQWYYDALTPWEHYVPVAADLSDLEEAAAWVLAHDDRARAIGAAGRHFALAQSFDAAIEEAITRLAAWIPHNPFAGFAPRGEENSS
jgi:hypothetical protein